MDSVDESGKQAMYARPMKKANAESNSEKESDETLTDEQKLIRQRGHNRPVPHIASPTAHSLTTTDNHKSVIPHVNIAL